MYYVYVLQSFVNKDLYIGYSKDLRSRFKQHNEGMVQYTKGLRPWKLVYYEAYDNKTDATYREKNLKQHKSKSDLKEHIENSLINNVKA